MVDDDAMSRPNILFVIADDHAPAAISSYGPSLVATPNLDRLASEGARFDRCFCTNSICTPARATVLTGKYSHTTGIRTLNDVIDHTRERTLGMMLHDAGYQTAALGKWHLGHGGNSDPAGFDHWSVLPVQGKYIDPEFHEAGGTVTRRGYVTDILADMALDWLRGRDPDRPFFLYLGNKAPHDPFTYDAAHAELFAGRDLPEPPTLRDDYRNRAAAAARSTGKVATAHLRRHVPEPPPPDLSGDELLRWNYQSFMKGYLRCVASVDDNLGRLLAYLDEAGLADDTLVVYTSDHGFFLGDHGFYDKRFMYEESIRIPLLMRGPGVTQKGLADDHMVLNVDFAPTLLDLAGAPIPDELPGRSLRPLLGGEPVGDWRTSMYYRYWMHGAHFNIAAHYGVRTETHKLIYYYGEPLDAAGAVGDPTPPEWELFDLVRDPQETGQRVRRPRLRLRAHGPHRRAPAPPRRTRRHRIAPRRTVPAHGATVASSQSAGHAARPVTPWRQLDHEPVAPNGGTAGDGFRGASPRRRPSRRRAGSRRGRAPRTPSCRTPIAVAGRTRPARRQPGLRRAACGRRRPTRRHPTARRGRRARGCCCVSDRRTRRASA